MDFCFADAKCCSACNIHNEIHQCGNFRFVRNIDSSKSDAVIYRRRFECHCRRYAGMKSDAGKRDRFLYSPLLNEHACPFILLTMIVFRAIELCSAMSEFFRIIPEAAAEGLQFSMWFEFRVPDSPYMFFPVRLLIW